MRYDRLYKVILDDINYHISKAKTSKNELALELFNKYQSNIEDKASTKEINRLEQRKEEIRIITKKMYEDYVLEKVSEVMYNGNIVDYNDELKNIDETLDLLYEVKNKKNEIESSITRFISLVSKYDNLEVLTREVLNDLIFKICVYQNEIIDKKRVQRIEIHYNFLP